MEYYLIILMIAAVLAFIPASIAKEKGYCFGLWWFYGWMLFIVSIIHVSLIPDKNAKSRNPSSVPYCPPSITPPEEIKQYKELLDSGAISQEEFEKKKKQILNS